MYFMHWTFNDVKSLTMDQLDWVVESINKVKKLENRKRRVK